MKKINWKILIASLAVVYSVALIGGLFTSKNVSTDWYNSIKPFITPPNFVFPIVWNILFFLIALSLYFAWTSAKDKAHKKELVLVFGLNLILNITWSFLFFYLQNPMFAFIELIVLWLSILLMIFATYEINKKSAYLLIPYLLWVSFAGVLNYLMAF